jgi:glucose/sorbosone dehydrogenase
VGIRICAGAPSDKEQVFNASWEEIRREAIFVELRQRIRNVRQGPDGLLYVLTDEDDGAILKLEPLEQRSAISPSLHNRVLCVA